MSRRRMPSTGEAAEPQNLGCDSLLSGRGNRKEPDRADRGLPERKPQSRVASRPAAILRRARQGCAPRGGCGDRRAAPSSPPVGRLRDARSERCGSGGRSGARCLSQRPDRPLDGRVDRAGRRASDEACQGVGIAAAGGPARFRVGKPRRAGRYRSVRRVAGGWGRRGGGHMVAGVRQALAPEWHG